MAGSWLLDRNVKPRHANDHDGDEDGEFEEDVEGLISDDEGEDTSETSLSEDADDRNNSENANNSENETESEGGDFNHHISNVSFGALLQAQDALSRKRKRGSDTTADQDTKLEAVRARLQEIRSQKEGSKTAGMRADGTTRAASSSRVKRPTGSIPESTTGDKRRNKRSTEVGSDSDSAPSEEGAASKSRTSKHAPTAQSSKHQVTRKRTVIAVPKRASRDPRFDALQQRSVHPGNSEKAYGFLRDYQKAEIAELKTAIKQTRNEDDKETLKRKLVSMENRLKTKEAKEREQEVLRRHRKEEREKVEQGKKPFFLKKKDLKERAQVEKFKGMKKKDQEKLIEKRRRKESQKEKKRMPEARRLAG